VALFFNGIVKLTPSEAIIRHKKGSSPFSSYAAMAVPVISRQMRSGKLADLSRQSYLPFV
jgi:hypothetical protein